MKIDVNPPREAWPSLLRRAEADDELVAGRVERIVRRVREGGDEALRELTRELDGVELDSLRVAPEEIAAASEKVGEEFKDALRLAAGNIEAFHRAQAHPTVDIETMPGVRCVQRGVPIRRVGLYVPGGSAPLLSTVLMLAIPARVAGCPEIMLCTPPEVAPEILYAASMCGVTEIYRVGGAQAVAAMAYGTRTIRAADKIFGPGNRYVTQAKQFVSNHVAIDMPAGPSEVMILADESAEVRFVAADMLSQAEHGPDSQAIAVVGSRALADRVAREIEVQLCGLSRSDMARTALENSRIIVMDDPAEMIAVANVYAAEHLIISMREPWGVAECITAAGSIFIGNYSPESAGDYASGTNHTLPTCGWARSMSGVNLESFVRRITLQELSRDGLQALSGTIVAIAGAEGLDAHANAVKIRML